MIKHLFKLYYLYIPCLARNLSHKMMMKEKEKHTHRNYVKSYSNIDEFPSSFAFFKS